MVGLLANVDGELAAMVAQAIGVAAPPSKDGKKSTKTAPEVSMANTVKTKVKARRVAILAAEGVNGTELAQVKQALVKAGAHPEVVSKFLGTITSVEGEEIEVNKNFLITSSVKYDAVFIPGGEQSVEALKKEANAVRFINEAFKHCKAIGAVGGGVDLLAGTDIEGVALAGSGTSAGLLAEEGIVTSPGGSNMRAFSTAFIEAIAQHRHWGRTQKEKVPA
jgi:catalase